MLAELVGRAAHRRHGCPFSDFVTSSDLSASLAARESLSMIGCGVPLGAEMPNHSTNSQSGMPDSIMVGRLGKIGLRLASVTPSATSLPAATWPATVEAGEK